jgi:microcompartment protein CcmK/EutM
MRLATVAGKVTLSVQHERLCCGSFLLVSPWKSETYKGEPVYDFSIVAFDQLGADIGQQVGISEGREAASPFENPVPLDAYCATLIDEIFYQEHEPGTAPAKKRQPPKQS